MKLICAPHYTCSGILTDMLLGTNNFDGHKTFGGYHHHVGKVGDSQLVHDNDSVYDSYDPTIVMNTIKNRTFDRNNWISTHCWPGLLPLSEFDKIINITTTTFKSKIYRWIRVYTHYYMGEWGELYGFERIDKMRSTAKNYLKPSIPVNQSPVYNLEFFDFVHDTQELKNVMQDIQYKELHDQWSRVNEFLYSDKLWNSELVDIFCQAEFEVNMQRYYIYE